MSQPDKKMHRSEVHDKSNNQEDKKWSLSFDILPEEIWFQVFSYGYGCDLFVGSYGRNNPTTIHRLFREVSVVSKGALECCTRYVQQTPISVKFYSYLLQLQNQSSAKFLCNLIWMRKTRVCIGDLRIDNTGFSNHHWNAGANIIMHYLIEGCCVDQLRHLEFSVYPPEGGDSVEGFAIRNGISPYIFNTTYISEVDFLATFTNVLAQRSSLDSLSVSVQDESQIMPFLQAFPNVSKLVLDYTSNVSDMEAVSQAIAGMPNLEELKIWTGYEADGSLKINSRSLKVLDATGLEKGYIINQCNCPSLELLIFAVYITPWISVSSVLQPITPFQEEECYLSCPIDFEAGSRSCVGLNVPMSCILRVGRVTVEEESSEEEYQDRYFDSDSDY